MSVVKKEPHPIQLARDLRQVLDAKRLHIHPVPGQYGGRAAQAVRERALLPDQPLARRARPAVATYNPASCKLESILESVGPGSARDAHFTYVDGRLSQIAIGPFGNKHTTYTYVPDASDPTLLAEVKVPCQDGYECVAKFT